MRRDRTQHGHWLLTGLALLVCLVGCDEMNTNQPPAPAVDGGSEFTLGIEQDAQRIPVRDHTVTLRKKPFRLVFYFERLSPMLVQASLDPTILEMTRKGRPMDDILRPGSGIAEDLMNPKRQLYMNRTGSYHNWLYLGPETHRFDPDGVHKLEQGGYLCRRTVSHLVIEGNRLPVSQCPASKLYMVFFKTDRSGTDRVERQRDWLTLKFTD